MGIVTGGLNGRRFRVDTPLPAGFRDLFLEQVRANAFVECDTAQDAEPRIGWVDVFDPANTTFELNTFLIDRYVALALRTDTKKVQGTYLKIAVAKRCAEVMAERGLESLTKADEEAIAEAVETDLMRRALPSVATTDVAWDILTNQVVVFGTSEGTLEHIRQLMKETFGAVIRPERMVDWLSGKLTDDEIAKRLTDHVAGGPSKGGDLLEGHELTLGSDFLTWLWLQSEETDGRFRVIDAGGAPQAVLAELVAPPQAEVPPASPVALVVSAEDAPTELMDAPTPADPGQVAVDLVDLAEAPTPAVAEPIADVAPAADAEPVGDAVADVISVAEADAADEADADADDDDDDEDDDEDDDDDDEGSWADVTETLRGADVTLWLDSRLKLQELKDRDPSESPATTILLGAAPSTTAEARQNLHLGKRPVEAQLGLKLNDLECAMAIAATPDGLRLSGVKIPCAVKSGKEDRLLERLVLLDLVHTTIARLFQQFFLARTSPAWSERVDRWLAEGLAAK